jgi:tungstate transport system ATP-binding protein
MSDAPVYTLDRVSVAYGDVRALDIERLEIPAGQVTLLAGPNGAGKTTLLHVLAFIERPQSGRMTFLGSEVTGNGPVDRRRRVGYLLQHPCLFDRSVAANVEYGLHIRGVRGAACREQAMAALELVGLRDLAGRHASQLSAGEAKRVALARILAYETDVLLLDEPIAHMDRASEDRTEALIQRLSRDEGRTIVLASHDAHWAEPLAHRVLPMEKGRLCTATP